MENISSWLLDSEVIKVGTLEILSETIDWGLIDIAIPRLWEKTRGDNISIMVVDTGISEHSDLNDNILFDLCRSFIPEEDTKDLTGHGTSVAGVIAAKDSEFGIVGVAPNSKIIAVKVMSKVNKNIIKSIEQALAYAKEVKPDIINMSLGSSARLSSHCEILIQELYDMNIPIVCAIGNSGDKYSCFPANYPQTFSASSYSKNRDISNFSSRGDDCDFALPGEQILTTSLNNQYAIVKGTSFAAPFLSGIIALILSNWKKNNKNYSIQELKDFLIKNTSDHGPTGKDKMYGYGIINSESLEKML